MAEKEVEVRRLAPPPEVVALEDINIRLKRLNEGINKLIELERQNLERLEAVETAVRETVPEGYLIPLTVNVVDSETVTFADGEEWSGFDYYNDGPDDVYIGVNTYPREEVAVHAKESGTVPFMGRGKIKRIYLVCGSGKSTTVRLWGLK